MSVAGRPFVVHVAKLRRSPGTRWHEVRTGVVEGLECTGSAVPPGEAVSAEVTVESVLGGVSVTGTVTVPWTAVCRRCLAPAAGTVVVPVRELYTEGGDGEDTYPLDGDDLDLEPLVRDAVLLELPQAPLCRGDCAGLCPRCGANRNEGDCGCRAAPDPRWAALDALRAPERSPDAP
ncbi:MAG TPA: DUF177 domain-containing protein [Acidimicrobiales bacterium]|nr:DUF177 domain-containing protein [Acidimicrobiales bacterium]